MPLKSFTTGIEKQLNYVVLNHIIFLNYSNGKRDYQSLKSRVFYWLASRTLMSKYLLNQPQTCTDKYKIFSLTAWWAKVTLSGHLQFWQMAQVRVRLCVSGEHSERVVNLGAWRSENQRDPIKRTGSIPCPSKWISFLVLGYFLSWGTIISTSAELVLPEPSVAIMVMV
jgi:hypothetical protein